MKYMFKKINQILSIFLFTLKMRKRCPPNCYSCGPPPSGSFKAILGDYKQGRPMKSIVREVTATTPTIARGRNGFELKGGGFLDILGKIGNGLSTALNIANEVAPAVGGLVNTFRGLKGGGGRYY